MAHSVEIPRGKKLIIGNVKKHFNSILPISALYMGFWKNSENNTDHRKTES